MHNAFHDLCPFLARKVFELGNLAIRQNKQVSSVVGILVHDNECMRTPMQDEVFLVIIFSIHTAERVRSTLAVLGGSYVFHAPVCVQMIHEA